MNAVNLTGESCDVRKLSHHEENSHHLFRSDVIVCTTSISSGQAKCIVFAIGMNTQAGGIATTLGVCDMNKSPIQRSLDWFGKYCFLIVFVFTALFLAAPLVQRQTSIPQKCSANDRVCLLFNAITFALIFGPALLPQVIPTFLSLAFVVGLRRLKRFDTIFQRVSAIDTLGCR